MEIIRITLMGSCSLILAAAAVSEIIAQNYSVIIPSLYFSL